MPGFPGYPTSPGSHGHSTEVADAQKARISLRFSLYLVVVEMAIDREAMASDSPLVTGCPHIATATHPNITACAHQLWGVLLHRLQAPGV